MGISFSFSAIARLRGGTRKISTRKRARCLNLNIEASVKVGAALKAIADINADLDKGISIDVNARLKAALSVLVSAQVELNTSCDPYGSDNPPQLAAQ